MALVNPFVPFTDLDPIQYRRAPLGEKAGMFFYDSDEEQVHKYLRCGGAVYPAVAVASVAECKVVDDGKSNRSGSGSSSELTGYAPVLSSTLKSIVKWIPALSYWTYKADTTAQITHSPGNFFFRLGRESPLYRNFTSSRLSAQALAFHPYFPIVAIAEQRSPLENAMIRFYDVGNSTFLDKIVLTHPKMRGVTEIAWKPHSKDVLVVGVYGGVMAWSIPSLSDAIEANMAAKANGKISLLRGGSTAQSTRGANRSSTFGNRSVNIANETTLGSIAQSPSGAAHHASLSVKKRPINELSHVFGATNSAKAAAAGLGTVDWSLIATQQQQNVALNNSTTSSLNENKSLLNTTLNPTEASNRLNNNNNSLLSMNAFISSSDAPAAFFLTYDFTPAIPVTAIAFSEVSGALMAVSSRGSPDTYIHTLGCRPRDSLLTVLTSYSSGISSNISCLAFSMDDSFLMRGYEDSPRLSVTSIANLQTKHFVTPAPILKIVRVEAIGFNVFALMLKGAEAVTIARIGPDAITVLANIVTGEHGETPVGGEVLDISCSSYNLYVRVASGHVLVMAITGHDGNNSNTLLLDESEIESRAKTNGKSGYDKSSVTGTANCQIGAYLKGGIPVPFKNRHVVKMDAFQNFTNGALLAVANGETGSIQFVPSYFTRGIEAEDARY